MKIKNLFSICLLLSLFVVSAQAQTADPESGCSLTINFTAGMNLGSYYWDFGDTGSSTDPNPIHIYSNPGVYTVNLSETNGSPILGTVTVTIFTKPQLSATADPDVGCAPLPVNFTNTSVVDPLLNVTSFVWTFGDSETGTSNNLDGISHTYNVTGVLNVGLRVVSNFESCNEVEIVETVDIASIPNLGFVVNPGAVSCTAPYTVSFTNTTPSAGLYDFEWEFGNGAPNSTEVTPPDQTYTAEGVYTVVLIATAANGCEDRFEVDIRVGPPMVDFIPQFDSICVNEIITIFNQSATPGQVSWTFGNGASPSNSQFDNPLVQFNEGGDIPITLTLLDAAGCSNSITKTIYVDAPDASFTSNPTYSCTKTLTTTFTPNDLTAATYEWLFSDSTMSSVISPTHTIVNMDTTIYSVNGLIRDTTRLVVTSDFGCVDTFYFVDSLHIPNALFVPDVANGCFPLDVTFTDSSTNDFQIVLWEWDFGDGSPVETYTVSTSPTHTYTQAGEFPVFLIITDEIGCKDTSFTFIVEVGDVLNPGFTVDVTEICPGDSVTFTPTSFPGDDLVDAWHFETDDTRSFHCFQDDVLTWAFESETGVFDATLHVEYNGCISQVTQSDLVTLKGPIARIDYLVDCANPFDISFRDSSDEATSVLWTFGDMTDSTLADVVHTYPDTGDYWVHLLADNPSTGCPASLDSVLIHVRDIHAEFMMLDTQLCLGNMYNLDASLSENVDNRCWRGYTWFFSDPNDRPITTQEPVTEHIFEAPGLNDVMLVTRDINGCLDTAMQTVDVFGVYPAFNVSDDTICLGQLIDFIDLSTADTTIVTWEWNFGDGTASTPNAQHVFGSVMGDSTVMVTLTLTDELGCGGMLSTSLTVYEPTSTITALPTTNICVGDQINFFASDYTVQGSSLDFLWDFGLGNPSSGTTQGQTVTYPTAGNFNTVLTFTEKATGCQGSETVPISVQDYPVASIGTNVDINDIICNNQQIEFTFNGTSTSMPLEYLWDFDGAAPNSNLSNPTLTFTNGMYNVIMTVNTSNGCSDKDSVQLEIVGPQGLLSLDKNAICLGESITFSLSDLTDVSSFTWDFGDGSSQVGGNPITHPYTDPTADTVKVELVGSNAICNFILEEPISVLDVDASSIIDTTGCSGDTLFFNALADPTLNTIFEWDFGDNSSMVFGSDTNHVYAEGGTYTVFLFAEETSLGCRDTVATDVVIKASPVVEIAGDGLLCQGKETPLTVVSPNTSSTYAWTPANLFANATLADVLITVPPGTVTLDVGVTETNDGCTGTDIKTLTLIDSVLVMPIPDSTVCPGQVVVLPVTGVQPYHILSWTRDDTGDLSCPDDCGDNPMLTVPNTSGPIVYVSVLNITDSIGCFNRNYEFKFRTPDGDFEMPNAFTPDGDGANDFFKPVPIREGIAAEDLDITRFQIYNRWGQKVYDNTEVGVGWDGTQNGKPAASDVYIYVIETDFAGCAGEEFRGNVTLIR